MEEFDAMSAEEIVEFKLSNGTSVRELIGVTKRMIDYNLHREAEALISYMRKMAYI